VAKTRSPVIANRFSTAVLALAVLGCSANESPSDGDGPGSVTGITQDAETGQPVTNADVVIAGITGSSGNDGRFRIDDIPSGRQPLSVAHAGYVGVTDSVSIRAGGTSSVTLALTPGSAPPPPPTGVHAEAGQAVGTTRITWQAVAGASGYNIYWSTSAGVSPSSGVALIGVSNPYIHSGLSGGTPYFYVVTATGSGGESGPTVEVSATPSGTMSVTLTKPANNIVDSAFVVAAAITSVNQLAGVTATIGSSSTPLAFDIGDSRWIATVSFGSLASPSSQQLTVTATDVQGTTAQVSKAVLYDRPPAVKLDLPAPDATATPLIHIKATCRDDGAAGCSDLSITANPAMGGASVVLVAGSADVDQTVSLAGFDGQVLQLEAAGKDERGQITRVAHTVYVNASGHLTAVATADSGTVLDADAGRLLVLHRRAAGDELRLVERSTGGSTVVFTAMPPDTINQANLTPVGALVLTGQTATVMRTLFELRNGALNTLVSGEILNDLLVSGGSAVYSTTLPRSSTTTLFRRDLAPGVTTTVASETGNAVYDVADNGDVAYWSLAPMNVFLSHGGGGASSQLTSDGQSFYPRTDGVHVVYTRGLPTTHDPRSILLADPGGDIVLATFPDRDLGPPDFYETNGGWIAFTRPDLSNTPQVWVRSPSGLETQISSLGTESRIEVLSPTGEVVFTSSATGAQRRYRGGPGVAVDIGPDVGRPLYIGTQLHVLIGSTLFRVD